MTRIALAVAVTAALALSACNRGEPADAASADAPVADAAPADAATPAPAPVTPVDEAKPAGTFSAADIAGIYTGDGTLDLKADGSYVQTGANAEDGTWAAEGTDGMHIRLDPNSKTAQDRVLHVTPDALTPMAAENAAPPSSTPFKRQATP